MQIHQAQTPELIDRFNWAARPWLDLFDRATCIEQSRILVEVLPQFGARAQAIETTMVVHCPDLNIAFVAGATAEERARGKSTAAEWEDRTTPAVEGYGHVVVLAEIAGQPYLVDPTISQASIPNRGLVIECGAVAVGPLSEWPGPECQLEAGFVLNDGKAITATWYIRDTRKFEDTPAWEPSHLWRLIHRIIREMKWAGVVKAAQESRHEV